MHPEKQKWPGCIDGDESSGRPYAACRSITSLFRGALSYTLVKSR
jgi:hypothetical protein